MRSELMFGEQHATANVPSIAAGAATEKHAIFVAPFRCTIVGVHIVPRDRIDGDNVDRKNLNVVHCGSDGTGTAEVGNLDLLTGITLEGFDAAAVSIASATVLDADSVLALEAEQVGAGVLLPSMLVRITYRPAGI